MSCIQFDETVAQQGRRFICDDIIKATAEAAGIPPGWLKSQSRKAYLIPPRFVGYYLCKRLTKASFPQIARAFDRTDHTTVLYGALEVMRGKREELNQALAEIEPKVRAILGVPDHA